MSGSLPSSEAFAARYRTLTIDERRAFITDLRETQGWKTTLEEGIVVATRDGATRRIAVDQPNRDVTVDVIVTADERLRSLAAKRNVDTLSPETLRDELLYGLDREKGMELLETHFGDADWETIEATGSSNGGSGVQGSEADEPSSETRARHAKTGSSRVLRGGEDAKSDDPAAGTNVGGTDDPGEAYDVSLLLAFVAGLALVLFLVLSSGLGVIALPDVLSGEEDVEATTGTDPVDADTSTEGADVSTTGTETSAEAESDGVDDGEETRENTEDPPPGISLDGTHDVEQIAATHAAAVEDHDSLRFQVRSEGPASSDGIDSPDNLDVQIAANNHFLIKDENDRHAPDVNVTVDVFADSVREYRRSDSPEGVRYNSYSITMEPTVTAWSGEYGADLIRTYLNTSESTVEQRSVDDRTAYQITANSPPPALTDEAAYYRASATVMSDGTVRMLTVTYRHKPTNQEVWIRFRYDIEETSVDTPLWYDRAREWSSSHPGSGE